MNDLKAIPFHSEHLKVMQMREYEKVKVYPFLTQGFLDACSVMPHCYTSIKDGRIITCGGLIPMWEGVYELWQIPSVYVPEYILAYSRMCRDFVEHHVKLLQIRRIHTFCPDDELHNRWMSFLEFECEGVLKKYNRFQDNYKIWGKLWD